MQKFVGRFMLVLFACLSIFFVIFAQKGFSADISINPVRIFFDVKNKTDIITIKNKSAEELTLQLRAYKWEQDEKGKDLYSPTKDLIFFPKIFKIQKDEKKIVRLGTKVPLGRHEKTYRLYIEEVPEPRTIETTAVRILLRIGVPVFISPLKTVTKGSIEKVELRNGSLFITVKNEGNNHFIIKSVKVAGTDTNGKEVFNTEIGGWYLHGGNSKLFTIDIPVNNCLKTKTLKIDINTDKLSIDEKLDISKEMCAS